MARAAAQPPPPAAARYTWHPDMRQWTAHLDGVALETPLVPLRADPGSHQHRTLAFAVLYTALLLLVFVVTLDGMTAFLYLNYACSEFNALASFGTVSIVQQLVCAVSKPPVAMATDRLGRMYALVLAVACAVAGYLVMGYAHSLPVLVAGVLIQTVGYTGIQVLQTVIIADTTSAKWRGLVLGMVNVPFLINFGIAGPLAEHILALHGWRTGYLMWAVILPLAALPLTCALGVGSWRARQLGPARRAPRVLADLDLVGMGLFAGGITLVLLPMSLHMEHTSTAFASGALVLALFVAWENHATHPFIPCALLANPTVLCICVIGMLDFAGFYLSWAFLSAFVQVVKDWNQTATAYFASSQNVTATVFGLIAGWSMVYFRRYKAILLLGIVIRLIGVTLMVRYRGVDHSTTMLVVCQIVQGIGGGAVGLTMQVAAQVAVSRSKLALVTALELLTSEIGAAAGAALAGALFSSTLPRLLHAHVPFLSDTERRALAGSLTAVHRYAADTPERQGIAAAWSGVMRLLCIVAFLVQIPALVFAVLVPDADLHDAHTRERRHSTRSETTALLTHAPAWRECAAGTCT